MYDKRIYKNSCGYHISTNNDEVRKLNTYQLIAANKLIFGKDDYTFTHTLRLLNSLALKRKDYWKDVFSLQKLGNDQQKIIIHSEPFIRIKDVRSFSKLSDIGNKIYKISFLYRGWFPRTPYIDDSFRNRMKIKLSMSSLPIDIISRSLSKTEIIKFNDLIMLYWSME